MPQCVGVVVHAHDMPGTHWDTWRQDPNHGLCMWKMKQKQNGGAWGVNSCKRRSGAVCRSSKCSALLSIYVHVILCSCIWEILACQAAVFSYPLHFSHFLLRFMDMRKNNVSNTYESRFPSRHTMFNPFIHILVQRRLQFTNYSHESIRLIFAVPCHRLSPRCEQRALLWAAYDPNGCQGKTDGKRWVREHKEIVRHRYSAHRQWCQHTSCLMLLQATWCVLVLVLAASCKYHQLSAIEGNVGWGNLDKTDPGLYRLCGI